jgi:hypothetical protein
MARPAQAPTLRSGGLDTLDPHHVQAGSADATSTVMGLLTWLGPAVGGGGVVLRSPALLVGHRGVRRFLAQLYLRVAGPRQCRTAREVRQPVPAS